MKMAMVAATGDVAVDHVVKDSVALSLNAVLNPNVVLNRSVVLSLSAALNLRVTDADVVKHV